MGNPFASDCSTALELVRDDFGTGAPIARVFMPGYVFVALCGPQLNLLTMTGNKRAAAGTMMVGAAIGVIGCVIGIQIYGPLGAAIGLALCSGCMERCNGGLHPKAAEDLAWAGLCVVDIVEHARGQEPARNWFLP